MARSAFTSPPTETTMGNISFDSLPGGELIRQGLHDLAQGSITVPALLVPIGATRLRRLGVELPSRSENPEHLLYELLHREDPDSAHSRYNALIRTLVSFERAAECVKK